MRLVPNPSLILRRSEIAALMGLQDYLAAVESAFRSYARGKADVPTPMHLPLQHGGFHVKGARVVLDDRTYVAIKLNGNFPDNAQLIDLPTIQGAVLLCDAADCSL